MTRHRPNDFTAAQKAAIFRRAKGRCEACGRKLGIGGEPWEANHKEPVWEGGTNDPENGEALCKVPCHADRTREQAGQRAEARRHERKVAGIKRQPKAVMPGSRAHHLKKRADGSVVDRRTGERIWPR